MVQGLFRQARAHRHALLALLVAGLLVASVVVAQAAAPGEPISQIEQELVDAVNAEREKHGLQPLIVNYSLMEAAYNHNEHMADVQKLAHGGIGDGDVVSRVMATGYQVYMGLVGENVAWGQRSVAKVMDDWMNSPGHRANILKREYTDIGVAFTTRNGGPWWTQVFATPVPPPTYVTVTPPAGHGRTCELTGDMDFDGTVTRHDVEITAARFLTAEGDPDWDARFDLVPDGIINVFDVHRVVRALGQSCPKP